jgi:hypothetical protein
MDRALAAGRYDAAADTNDVEMLVLNGVVFSGSTRVAVNLLI